MSLIPLTSQNREAWNQAYARLREYLATYGLTNDIHLAELSLRILEKAVATHGAQPQVHPTTLTMNIARTELADWFSSLIKNSAVPRSQVLPIGHVALLLSQVPRRWPTAFLSQELPAQLESTMKQSLMVTGPTLNVSSMTPRALDYGPLLQIAQQTWHQWNARRFLFALLFWAGIYLILYFFVRSLPQFQS